MQTLNVPDRCCIRDPRCLSEARLTPQTRQLLFRSPRFQSPFRSTRNYDARNWPFTDGRSLVTLLRSSIDGEVAACPIAAVEGDVVSVHYTCRDTDGQVLDSSYESNEPATFELGAGEIVGNKLFQAFDSALRGLCVGDKTLLKASGGEWQRGLLFDVPREHEEVQRLEARYKNVGGLAPGLVVELANGSLAVVLQVGDTSVRLDANNMLAGKALLFELELVNIERGV